jgi:ribosome-binding ATPase
MHIGIVGLPYTGKTTLFETIAKTHLDPADAGKSDAHHAIVKVPDARMDLLSSMFNPKSTVYATIEFVDVVGLKKGETGSAQFTSNFLANVKTSDALVHVVRLFHDDGIPHIDGSLDAARDITSFETEFILSDMAILESRIDKIAKQIQKTGGDLLAKEQAVLTRCHAVLDKGRALREETFSPEELHILKTYQLLTIKPILIALNLDEKERPNLEATMQALRTSTGDKVNTKFMSFFGKIEKEISQLPDEEAKLFMTEYGITESALTTLIREAYDLLGLQSFFTVGEDECRAWTITKGMTAQEASGVIHSSFVKKFIRAEVVGYNDFIEDGGSFAKVKERGRWRLEGKDYIVKEGDILTIRHG